MPVEKASPERGGGPAKLVGETLMQRCRVEEEGFRILNSC